jgi:hypothetical protein
MFVSHSFPVEGHTYGGVYSNLQWQKREVSRNFDCGNIKSNAVFIYTLLFPSSWGKLETCLLSIPSYHLKNKLGPLSVPYSSGCNMKQRLLIRYCLFCKWKQSCFLSLLFWPYLPLLPVENCWVYSSSTGPDVYTMMAFFAKPPGTSP